MFESDIEDLDPAQYAEADRPEVDPPIEVETATWSAGGTLDWWVKPDFDQLVRFLPAVEPVEDGSDIGG